MHFKKVTIIGFGLIGSSLARILRREQMADIVVAADINPEVCAKALALNICDEASGDIGRAVQGADLVIISAPVGAYGAIGAQIQNSLKAGALITDVGSVKGAAIEMLTPYIPDGVHFIPGHPIAGTEYSGPEAGFAELFENRWCILTPLPHSDIKAVEKLTRLWEACGSMIEIMDVAHHDLILGTTSHLPHLIAYTIVGTATTLEEDIKGEVIKFSASGFRDFTRIAASDPVMWRDVFLNNKTAVLEMLQRFNEDLSALQKAIRRGDGDFLFDFFTKTRAIRRAIIEQGQADYRAPGGVVQEGTPPVAGLRTKTNSSA